MTKYVVSEALARWFSDQNSATQLFHINDVINVTTQQRTIDNEPSVFVLSLSQRKAAWIPLRFLHAMSEVE